MGKTEFIEHRSVCFVSQELPQFFKNGGAGTAILGFAEALADANFDVSILYVSGVHLEQSQIEQHVADLRARGIKLHLLDAEVTYTQYRASVSHLSYAIYEWLRTKHFRVVHFNDFDGLAFYSLHAKRCNLAFMRTTVCVFMHGMHRWAAEITEAFYDERSLMIDHMERRSVALADQIMSPSRYMLNYLHNAGFQLPENVRIQRGVLPNIRSDKLTVGSQSPACLHEIVFFGRHEIRKGFLLFLDAVERLLSDRGDTRVTLLGKSGPIHGVESTALAERRLKKFSDRVEVFSPAEQSDLIARLRSPGAVVVIPSLDDNLPNTVFECIQWGINFIASNVGGIPELLDEKSATERLFVPKVSELIAKIEDVIARPRAPAKLGFDPIQERHNFIDWHLKLSEQRPIVSATLTGPLVTVCLVHFERPIYLRQALQSIAEQTYRNIEVVVVDDGSRSVEAKEAIASIEKTFTQFPVKIVRTPDIGLGAARNAGAKVAAGEYILFMDDDNVACPDMIATFVEGALASGAQILTGLAFVFDSAELPTSDMKTEPQFLPLGSAEALGMFRNCYGDAHSLWKLSVFEAVGGFAETRAPSEDWELLARASLQGYDVVVIPEQLHWRRVHKESLTNRPYSMWQSYTQIADAYAMRPPRDMKYILRVAQRYVSFAAGSPLDPYQAIAEVPKFPRSTFQLSRSDLAVAAAAGDSLKFPVAPQWKELTAQFQPPADFLDAGFRACVSLESESPEPISLRFAFITGAPANVNAPENVAEIWFVFEPGVTYVQFSQADMTVLSGSPMFSAVRTIYFGGSASNVTIQASLDALRNDGSNTDIVLRDDGRRLRRIVPELGGSDLAVAAAAGDSLKFPVAPQWKDLTAQFQPPADFLETEFRACVLLESESPEPISLRFAFITGAPANVNAPENVAEIWFVFEPGVTYVQFSQADMTVLSGSPMFSAVRTIYFGGSASNVTIQASLDALRNDGSNTDIVLRDDGRRLRRIVPELGGSDLAVAAAAGDSLKFPVAPQWKDLTAQFQPPADFLETEFRACVLLESESPEPISLRFAFITGAPANVNAPENVAEIWFVFEPGVTYVQFSQADMTVLSGSPMFSAVRTIYFGGSASNVTIQASLGALRNDGSNTDIVLRDDGRSQPREQSVVRDFETGGVLGRIIPNLRERSRARTKH